MIDVIFLNGVGSTSRLVNKKPARFDAGLEDCTSIKLDNK